MILRYFTLIGMIAFALLLGGCSSPKVSPVAKFTLMHPSKIKFKKRHQLPSIFVSPVVANSGYKGSHLVYIDKPYQIKKFSKNAWVAPPAKLMHGLLIESLRNSNLFVSVNSPPYSGISKYRLDTKLLILQHEFLQKPSVVRVVAEVSVVNSKTHQTIAQKRFHVVQSTKGDNPYAGVVAANEGIHSLFGKIVHYLATLKLA